MPCGRAGGNPNRVLHLSSFERSDIHADSARTERLIRDSEVVIDLVAYANPSVYISNPLDVFRVNFAANLEIIDMCINYISSNDEPVAVKAFSLSILQNLSEQYPEIKNEVKLIIEERWPHETAAFHSRARKFLKTL